MNRVCLGVVSDFRIEMGTKLAAKRDVRGTRTLIVNGWKFASPLCEESLGKMIAAVLAGKRPSPVFEP